MFNKIYKKIKDYILNNFIEIIILILMLFITLYPVNYYIVTGGGIFDAKTRVSIKTDNKIKGSFNFSYVSEIKGTIFTYLLSYVVPSFERNSVEDSKSNENETVEDINFRNRIWLNQTNNIATYVAYNRAGKTIKEKTVKNYVFYLDENAKTDLRVGDEIISISDNEISDIDEFKKIVNSRNVGDKVTIRVRRNNKEYERYAYIYLKDNTKYVGVVIIKDVVYKTDPSVKFKFKSSESGPSGGLILALQMYNMLIDKDITKGYKIAGTGMINEDGSISEIDGIKYKLNGAVNNKCDIFLAPSGNNYKEAVKEAKKNNYKIKIISVNSFDEALEKLSNLKKK